MLGLADYFIFWEHTTPENISRYEQSCEKKTSKYNSYSFFFPKLYISTLLTPI